MSYQNPRTKSPKAAAFDEWWAHTGAKIEDNARTQLFNWRDIAEIGFFGGAQYAKHAQQEHPPKSQAIHVWRVYYSTLFETTSGMGAYQVRNSCSGLVTTTEATIEAAKHAISAILDPQSQLEALHRAVYLGETTLP